MGGSVFVENKGGAGGNIGMSSVARAEADGYIILLSTSAYAVNPSLYHTLPYDPFKDFTAICELAVSPHVSGLAQRHRAAQFRGARARAPAYQGGHCQSARGNRKNTLA